MQRFALLKIATEVQKVVHTALRFARRACEVVQIFWPKWNAVRSAIQVHHTGLQLPRGDHVRLAWPCLVVSGRYVFF